MSWLLKVLVRPCDFDEVSAKLWDAGTTGIAELPGPQASDLIQVVAGFDSEEAGGEAVRLFDEASAILEPYDDTAWSGPPEREVKVGGQTIIIDAKQSFGHGYHPTTRLVCDTLSALVGRDSSFLDVGTGSGILAIAASKLGASSVVGTDIDPAAVEAAKANAAANGVTVDVRSDGLAAVVEQYGRFDLVAANLLVANLRPIAIEILDAVGETLVISGCLEDQVEEVIGLFAPLRPVSQLEQDGWVCVVLR